MQTKKASDGRPRIVRGWGGAAYTLADPDHPAEPDYTERVKILPARDPLHAPPADLLHEELQRAPAAAAAGDWLFSVTRRCCYCEELNNVECGSEEWNCWGPGSCGAYHGPQECMTREGYPLVDGKTPWDKFFPTG
ncbi:hypothetical protein [Streptomyces decoyicus]|uniref:hypothetical protein n=1 Tax=Streptomyces decoyicus TaxID=249567 RepID=UPI00364FC822